LVFPVYSLRHPDNNECRVDDDDALEASDDDESGMDVDQPEASNDALMMADLQPTQSSHSLSAFWTCQLWASGRAYCTAYLCHFSSEEYDRISREIEDEPVNGHGSVIVSGQPGTGEIRVSLSHGI
jgi:hypothetical protein